MKTTLDHKLKAILECLKEADAPMGSWNLTEKLEDRQIYISSATVGRLLNQLEKMGCVKKESVNGRVITLLGLQTLAENELSQYRSLHQQALENMIVTDKLEDYIMILQARRIIEQETARLAALHVKEEDLKQMEEILDHQDELQQRGESIARVDIEFHKRIAQSSGNKVLEALYHLLFTYGQQSEAFERIRRSVGHQLSRAHREILEALKKRDPEAAQQAMVHHIDGLIEDLEHYWDSQKKIQADEKKPK